jgi:hypothetical protein
MESTHLNHPTLLFTERNMILNLMTHLGFKQTSIGNIITFKKKKSEVVLNFNDRYAQYKLFYDGIGSIGTCYDIYKVLQQVATLSNNLL